LRRFFNVRPRIIDHKYFYINDLHPSCHATDTACASFAGRSRTQVIYYQVFTTDRADDARLVDGKGDLRLALTSASPKRAGPVECNERLGGLLKFYYRKAG